MVYRFCVGKARKGLVLKKYIPFIIFCILTLFWVGFIFANSAQTGEESGAASSAVVEAIENILEKIGFDSDVSERLVRKLAHFLEYMILSLLVSADIIFALPKAAFTYKKYSIFLISPIFSLLIACVDEFCVQALTVGRGPSFRDVCIDTAGGLTGALVFVFTVFIVSVIRKRKKVS